MKNLFRISLGLFLLLFSFVLVSCEDDDDNPAGEKEQIKLQTSTTLGSYLVDKDNRTLYFFSNDFNGQNNCPTGNCENLWPYFNVENLTADQLGNGLSLTDFTTITAANGKKQLTYKGWPLYYYAPLQNGTNVLEAPGLTTGEGVGNIWFVAKPDYTIMLENAQLVGHDGKSYKSDYTEGTGKTLYFTDAKGRALYTFKNDKFNKNNFTNNTAAHDAIWPIYETDKVVVPSILDKTLFGSIDVFGKKQLTYKGWPLYYFNQDEGVQGANKGISFPSVAIWPVPVKDMPAATP